MEYYHYQGKIIWCFITLNYLLWFLFYVITILSIKEKNVTELSNIIYQKVLQGQ